MELRDRVAVIAGVASPIGAAVARRFAAEGARLALGDPAQEAVDRTVEELRQTAESVSVDGSRVDLDSESQVRAWIDDVLGRAGRIDALVNAMGAADSPVQDEPGPAAWQRRLGELTACAVCGRAVAPHMRARGRGRIVNVAAVAGRYRSTYFRSRDAAGSASGHAAAHGGILALTRELALELGPQGVTVNAVVPGWILTERSRPEWERLPEPVRRDVLAEISLGRPGRPEEVAGAVLFLASDAGSYVSGTAIDVNGGWWMS
jgi:NAD(P)-dependent dehydrogenase (short-subunit alcohol dehydrogenase family)